MKAVGFIRSLPVEDTESLFDFETDIPVPGPRQLLVKVEAVSVNPVDTKRRAKVALDKDLQEPMVLGFDAVGTVAATGENCELFEEGDAVWYAGSIDRPGSNAEYQVVDERIVGRRPRNLTAAEAAALPLTAITAWEAMFDRMNIVEDGGAGNVLLIIGAAGGVGSIATQLARQLTDLVVIATASRPETVAWCSKQGAHNVVNHYDLIKDFRATGVQHADYILNCADTFAYWDTMAELIAPEGKIASIVESEKPVQLTALMLKSATFVWEMMSTRPMFGTRTMIRQHEILDRLADLVESEAVRSTMTSCLQGLSASTLREAHALLESQGMIGKLSINY